MGLVLKERAKARAPRSRTGIKTLVEREVAGCDFKDEPLGRRFGKQKKYPALTLTVIHAQERGTPKRRQKIEWKLLTDLPIQSRKDAIETLG